MSKSPSSVVGNLELAKAEFDRARLQLIWCEALGGSVEPTLLRIAGLLDEAKSGKWSAADRQGARQLLVDLRAYARRTQLLLDAAAAFQCGVALAGPPVPETYTPDGGWQTAFPNDHICLRA